MSTPTTMAQAAFERREREARIARILHAAKVNPELSLTALAERFNMTTDSLRDILGREDCARRAAAQLKERECRLSGGGPARSFNPWRHK